MAHTKVGGDVFESGCDLIDVTSLHRPDTAWVFTDARGHEHRWYEAWETCEACDAGFRLVADGVHYDDARGGLTWGVCRKRTPRHAKSYSPSAKYETPTLAWVKDGEEFWEDDDEPHDIGHLECRQCGEHVAPRYAPDSTTQHIPGLRWCRINGQLVSKDEFERRLTEAARG